MWMPNDIFGNIFTMCTLDIDDLQLFQSKFIAHIKARLDQLLKHANENSVFTWKRIFWVFLPTALFCLCSDLFTLLWKEIAASSCQPLSLEMSDVLILPAKKHQHENQRNIMWKTLCSKDIYLFKCTFWLFTHNILIDILLAFCLAVVCLLSHTWKMHSSAKCKNSKWLDYPNVCKGWLRQASVHI